MSSFDNAEVVNLVFLDSYLASAKLFYAEFYEGRLNYQLRTCCCCKSPRAIHRFSSSCQFHACPSRTAELLLFLALKSPIITIPFCFLVVAKTTASWLQRFRFLSALLTSVWGVSLDCSDIPRTGFEASQQKSWWYCFTFHYFTSCEFVHQWTNSFDVMPVVAWIYKFFATCVVMFSPKLAPSAFANTQYIEIKSWEPRSKFLQFAGIIYVL